MIVSTKSIVKLPFEGPALQERLKLGEELLGRMAACQRISAWVVDDDVVGVETVDCVQSPAWMSSISFLASSSLGCMSRHLLPCSRPRLDEYTRGGHW